MTKRIFKIFIGIAPLLIFFIFWEFVIATNEKSKFLYGSPSLVYNSLIANIENGILIKDTYITGLETFLGFILGNLFGAFIGLSLWFSRTTAIIAKPYIIAIGSIPVFAIAPMMIIWFGTGLFAKVMMAMIATITLSINQCYDGAQDVEIGQINLLKSFGANNKQIFRKLIIPSSLSSLFSSLKLNVSFALLGAYIGEFISADSGLGFRTLKAGGLYDIPLVLASLLCIILLSFFLYYLISFFERKVLKWKE